MGKAAEQVDLNIDNSTGDAADVLKEFKAFLEKNTRLKEGKEDV